MDLTENLEQPGRTPQAVRLKVRPDLQIFEQKYEGKTFHVVKDPVCLRYYRFNKQEYFVFQLFDGKHTMEQVREAVRGRVQAAPAGVPRPRSRSPGNS